LTHACLYDVTVGYGIPVGHPATAVTARPSQPHTGRGAPAAGAPGRTYVGFTSPGNVSMSFLADRTATQYDRLLVASCRLSVCLSVTLCILSSQGRCTGLKVVPACSWQASSYFSL